MEYSALPSEWSTFATGDLPPDASKLVERVHELVSQLPPTGPAAASLMVPDRPRVISILGGRGSGKSTILHFSAAEMSREPDNIVLPPIDPENFAPGDSLLGWALAHLDHLISAEEKACFPVEGIDESLGQQLEELRRFAAIRSTSYLAGLEASGLTFEDFGRDAVKVPAHGVRVADRLNSWIEALARLRRRPRTRLVVPIDDADLFPELLPMVVSDAQLLGASPRSVILFAADQRSLDAALRVGYLETSGGEAASQALTHGLLTAQEVRESVARRLVKHFPRSLRVRIEELDPAARLQYAPIGEGMKTILDLFEGFQLPSPAAGSLADKFKISSTSGETITHSPYALCLSENRRDLRQLHEALARLDPTDSEATGRALLVILDHGLDALRPTLPPDAQDCLELLDGEPVRLQFDFSRLDSGKVTVGGLRLYLRPSDEPDAASSASAVNPTNVPTAELISARRPSGHWLALEPPAGPITDSAGAEGSPGSIDSGASAGDTNVRLPEQYAHLVFLAWEHASKAGGPEPLKVASITSRLALPGGMSWDKIVVGPSEMATEWPYWVIPRWDEYSRYFVYEKGWGIVLDALGELHETPRTTPPIELALLAHLHLVVCAHRFGQIPAWIVSLPEEDIGDLLKQDRWVQMRTELQASFEQSLAEAVAADKADRYSADLDEWASSRLPLSASLALTTTVMSDWLLNLWSAASTPADRARAVETLAEHARRNITSPLADDDIALLRRIEAASPEGEGSRADALEVVRLQYRERRTQQRGSVRAQLVTAGADEAILGQLDRSGTTQDVLLSLLQLGLTPADLTAVAEAFPEVKTPKVDLTKRPVIEPAEPA